MKGKVGDVGKHIHHEQLVEIYTQSQESREAYIRLEKPENEHPTRLRLIGVIPDQYLPQEVLAAREIFRQARAAYDQAWTAYDQAWAAWTAYKQARAAYNQARAACNQAIFNNREHFESTHHLWCEPDCPWNGATLFP